MLIACMHVAYYWWFRNWGLSPFIAGSPFSSSDDWNFWAKQGGANFGAYEWSTNACAFAFLACQLHKVIIAVLAALVVNSSVNNSARKELQASQRRSEEASMRQDAEICASLPDAVPLVAVQVALPRCLPLNTADSDWTLSLLQHVCAIEWPRPRLLVQVFLDSPDQELSKDVDAEIRFHQKQGTNIVVIRSPRGGGQCWPWIGALEQAPPEAKYVALFNGSVLPGPTFLQDCLPYLESCADLPFVETRWEANNLASDSCGAFARFVNVSFQHVVQSVRSFFGLTTGFSGAFCVLSQFS